jgi:hypothetical protein
MASRPISLFFERGGAGSQQGLESPGRHRFFKKAVFMQAGAEI